MQTEKQNQFNDLMETFYIFKYDIGSFKYTSPGCVCTVVLSSQRQLLVNILQAEIRHCYAKNL